jgi:adenylate cyclase class IV
MRPQLYKLSCLVATIGCSGATFVPSSLPSRLVFRNRRYLATREMPSLEVEQKFQLSKPEDLEAKLKSLGFLPKGTAFIVDWYFDTEANNLSVKDCWLRFREKSGNAQWELKMGRGDQGTTVYEEIEGEQACTVACSVLSEVNYVSKDRTQRRTFEGFLIPQLPIKDSHGLHPFCRLETKRSSWFMDSSESPFSGLVVDLDTTNTGHTVGEVETLCKDESEVAAGKQLVESLIAELTGNNGRDSQPAIGKLENFLLNNRPEHYAACVASGVLQDTP